MYDLVREYANRAHDVAKAYAGKGQDSRVAAEHGLAIACKGQLPSFKNAVRAELRTRGYRI